MEEPEVLNTEAERVVALEAFTIQCVKTQLNEKTRVSCSEVQNA
jgi:hypothetical protein